jgi:hypothetical protein
MSQYPDPCPDTGRRVVTVAQWHNRPDELIDEYAYWFDPEAAAMGLDPWALLEGIDAHTRDGLYDVLYVRGTYRTTPGEQVIYVRAQHYEALKCAASLSGS